MAYKQEHAHTCHVHPHEQTNTLEGAGTAAVHAGQCGCAFTCLETTDFLKILTWYNLEIKKRNL